MARKTWIKLKRGVLDGKHVRAIGPALWLFCLLCDRADWETGAVSDWKDSEAAEALDINPHTARDWRQRLVRYGYIDCRQTGQAITVKIHNWTNPREYGGDVQNQGTTRPADVGDAWEPSKGDVKTSPYRGKGSVPGSVSGSVSGDVSPTLPSLSPQNHIPQNQEESPETWIDCPKGCGGRFLSSHLGTWVADNCDAHRPIGAVPHKPVYLDELEAQDKRYGGRS